MVGQTDIQAPLAGRVALVTGAARGIGAAIARRFAQAGAAVMLTDVLEDPLRETAGSLSAEGLRVAWCVHDVCDDSAWGHATAKTVECLGGLDILVNNAGIFESGAIPDFSIDRLRRLLDVNVTGLYLGMQHAIRAMRPEGVVGHGGCVLNVSSIAATTARPGVSAYGASKAAVERMTKIAAVEAGRLGWGIRFNCLYPGVIETDMGDKLLSQQVTHHLHGSVEMAKAGIRERTPLGRLGTVADIAEAALYLCSDAAAFITGGGLTVDGGVALN